MLEHEANGLAGNARTRCFGNVALAPSATQQLKDSSAPSRLAVDLRRPLKLAKPPLLLATKHNR